MKNGESKQNEEKLETTKEKISANRQPDDTADHERKETIEERAKRENWTDVAESHLGIDE